MKDVKDVPGIAAPLCLWYRQGHRDLPWRNTRDPYAIWISEIMLQQTRTEAVKPYYFAFLEALPNVEALASVSDEKLNKLWQGLGYYSRARNLKRAAGEIMSRFGGRMPQTKQELLTLPGIGSYTAGAIASIAFGEAVPAVDGNVLRVISRLIGDGRDILDPNRKREYEALLLPVIPKDGAGDFTQALIELGATICGPNTAPNCEICPLNEMCCAYQEGLTDKIPYRAPKQARKKQKKTVMVISDGTRWLLHKRGAEGLLAGLYEFPTIEGEPTPNQVYEELARLGVSPISIVETPPAKHIFTHIEWDMAGICVTVDGEKTVKPKEGSNYVWVTLDEMREQYAIPSAFRAFVPKGAK